MVKAQGPSISREIIYGSFDAVKKLINEGANVNERDVWGFNPLIQAVICNKPGAAHLLVQHGVNIDQKDIMGQTALQWAVNRRNLELIQLFLEHGADPNHYSQDGQPILVNPILRGESEIIQLLVNKGGDLSFANDYITAKLIGHRFELVGKGDIINTRGQFIELDFEGFYLEFTVGIILRTLINFVNSPVGKGYTSYASVMNKIIQALRDASILAQYKYAKEKQKGHEKEIRELLDKEVAVIPVSYEGHAITFVKHRNLFAKNDRGVKHIVDTVVLSHVGNIYALNASFLSDLMYTKKTNEYIREEVKKVLKLTPFTTMPARYQVSGNCSWANVEASVPAMMFMLMFRGDVNNRGEIATLKNSIMSYYDTWVEWDKDRVLDESIQYIQETKDRAHGAAKASILGAILLQRCNPTIPKELARAKKILSILTLPEYRFILDGYIKVYATKAAGDVGKYFMDLLKICGVSR